MNLTTRLISIGALTFVAGAAYAQTTVTVDLGLSAENFIEYGLGAPPGDTSGNSFYALTQGSCTGTVNTTCNLTGSFTGATSGFTSGTYDLVSTYDGVYTQATSPVLAVSESPGSNYFNYLSLPASFDLTLELTTPGGTVDEPIVTNGYFVQYADGTYSGADVLFSTYQCSGAAVASCTQANVGLVDGAVGQGLVTGGATFEVASTDTIPPGGGASVPEPASWGILLAGLGAMGALIGTRRRESLTRPGV